VHLPAARATTVSYAQVAFAALWGWLVFGEGIGAPTLAGAGLILASILVSQAGTQAMPGSARKQLRRGASLEQED